MGVLWRTQAVLSVFSCSGLGARARTVYMGESSYSRAFTWGKLCVYMGESNLFMLFTWGNALGSLLAGLWSFLCGFGRKIMLIAM
jgi:hypothetical protein